MSTKANVISKQTTLLVYLKRIKFLTNFYGTSRKSKQNGIVVQLELHYVENRQIHAQTWSEYLVVDFFIAKRWGLCYHYPARGWQCSKCEILVGIYLYVTLLWALKYKLARLEKWKVSRDPISEVRIRESFTSRERKVRIKWKCHGSCAQGKNKGKVSIVMCAKLE